MVGLEQVDEALVKLTDSADPTNRLKPDTYVDRHFHSKDQMSADVEVERLRAELGVEGNDLDLRIMIECVDVL